VDAAQLPAGSPQGVWQASLHAAKAMMLACRGERTKAEEAAAVCERGALSAGATGLLALLQSARGLLELGCGRHEDAYERLRRISEVAGPAYHRLIACLTVGDLAEAACRSGNRAEGEALIRAIEPQARRLSSRWVQGQLSLVNVHLAPESDAPSLFQEALAHETCFPMIRGRIELAYGEWLRRHRRRRESRVHLRAASEVFIELGAARWAERAARELCASGERSRRRDYESADDLSPQELQIVSLAAEGLSNKEIAQRLYLSHRTVESHLYRVYPKLEVTSRAQLLAALRSRPEVLGEERATI
jgi:DNA-binding CsgD family transcriptional regulator